MILHPWVGNRPPIPSDDHMPGSIEEASRGQNKFVIAGDTQGFGVLWEIRDVEGGL